MTTIDIVDTPPSVREIVSTINKVCDLPNRDEKWVLLKVLGEILTVSAYPAIIVGNQS